MTRSVTTVRNLASHVIMKTKMFLLMKRFCSLHLLKDYCYGKNIIEKQLYILSMLHKATGCFSTPRHVVLKLFLNVKMISYEIYCIFIWYLKNNHNHVSLISHKNIFYLLDSSLKDEISSTYLFYMKSKHSLRSAVTYIWNICICKIMHNVYCVCTWFYSIYNWRKITIWVINA